jgi:LysM repeat protein
MKEREAEMKSKWWIVALVLAGHVVAVGILLVSQGCGMLRGRSRGADQPPPPPLPAATRPTTVNTARPPLPGTTRVVPPAPSPAPTPKPLPIEKPAAQASSHVVAKGETLSSIANRYGLSVGEVAALNGIQDKNKLRIGQKLVIPAGTSKPAVRSAPKPAATPKAESGTSAASVTGVGSTAVLPPGTPYQVKAGDTLSGIAKQYGVKVDAIVKANALTSDRIRVGQKLVIPDKNVSAAVAAPKPEPPMVETPKTNAPAPIVEKPAEIVASKPAVKAVDPAVKAAEPVKPVVGATKPAVGTTKPAAVAAKTGGTAAPVAPVAGADTKTRIHVVEKGEDLYSVSLLWGVTIEELKRVNGLTGTTLEEGMRLKIPVAGP